MAFYPKFLFSVVTGSLERRSSYSYCGEGDFRLAGPARSQTTSLVGAQWSSYAQKGGKLIWEWKKSA